MGVTRQSLRSWAQFVTAGGVVLTLALPTFEMMIGMDNAPALNERRVEADPPALPTSIDGVWQFPKSFDAFFSDHFGFRSRLLRFRSRVLWVLGSRPTDAVKVVVGRNGWLYYSGDDLLRYIEGRNLFTDAELRQWSQCLQQRGRWLARRGIRYLIVIAPGKASIYPEHLPYWLRPSTVGTRLDQLVLAARGLPDVDVLDLRPALRDAKRLRQVYDPTGTHWNAIGAYAAYAAIIGRLGAWFPDERPLPSSAFALTWTRQPGDLAEMLGAEHFMKEAVPVLAPRSASRVRQAEVGPLASFGLRAPVVTEKPLAGIPRVVVFRDSFAISLIPYLSEHFARGVYIWTPDFTPAVVERERPNLVIQEYAERFLSVLRPGNDPIVAAVDPTRRTPQP